MHVKHLTVLGKLVLDRLGRDVGVATTTRAAQITMLRMGLIMAVSWETSVLEEVITELLILLEIVPHLTALVSRCRKVERESTSGEVRRYFRAEVCSAANAGHMGTCESCRSRE